MRLWRVWGKSIGSYVLKKQPTNFKRVPAKDFKGTEDQQDIKRDKGANIIAIGLNERK
jgi:hypothetical protein